MANQLPIVSQIKRGTLEGTVTQDKNQYFCTVFQGGKKLKEAGPYFDQDEADMELGTLIDNAWREAPSTKDKLVRRM